AEPALSADDVEGDHDAVTGCEACDVGADRLDDADRLVADAVARRHRRLAMEEVQVRTADRRRGDADDRVVRVLDHRGGDVRDADLVDVLVDDRFHPRSSTNSVGTSPARLTSTFAALT